MLVGKLASTPPPPPRKCLSYAPGQICVLKSGHPTNDQMDSGHSGRMATLHEVYMKFLQRRKFKLQTL